MVSREVAFDILKQWVDGNVPLEFVEVEPQGSINSIGKATWPVRIKFSGTDVLLVSLIDPEKSRLLPLPLECEFEYGSSVGKPFTRAFPPEDSYGIGLEIRFPDGRTASLVERPEE